MRNEECFFTPFANKKRQRNSKTVSIMLVSALPVELFPKEVGLEPTTR